MVLIDTISAAQREELLPISACKLEKKIVWWSFSRNSIFDSVENFNDERPRLVSMIIGYFHLK
jgi:hypothetical protein